MIHIHVRKDYLFIYCKQKPYALRAIFKNKSIKQKSFTHSVLDSGLMWYGLFF